MLFVGQLLIVVLLGVLLHAGVRHIVMSSEVLIPLRLGVEPTLEAAKFVRALRLGKHVRLGGVVVHPGVFDVAHLAGLLHS